MLFEQNYSHANKTIRNRTVHLNFHQHRFGSNVASIITICHFCSHAWFRIWHFCVSHCVALHCAVQFIHISFQSRAVACRATLHLCVFKAYVVCITYCLFSLCFRFVFFAQHPAVTSWWSLRGPLDPFRCWCLFWFHCSTFNRCFYHCFKDHLSGRVCLLVFCCHFF